jgi:phage-related protein
MKRTVQLYETTNGKAPVEKFLRTLTTKELAKVLAAFKYVEQGEAVPASMFCKMVSTDDLWEIRVKVDGNKFRFLSFFDAGRLIIVAHGFQKKTQKTPRQEIKTAETRKKEYFKRNK